MFEHKTNGSLSDRRAGRKRSGTRRHGGIGRHDFRLPSAGVAATERERTRSVADVDFVAEPSQLLFQVEPDFRVRSENSPGRDGKAPDKFLAVLADAFHAHVRTNRLDAAQIRKVN